MIFATHTVALITANDSTLPEQPDPVPWFKIQADTAGSPTFPSLAVPYSFGSNSRPAQAPTVTTQTLRIDCPIWHDYTALHMQSNSRAKIEEAFLKTVLSHTGMSKCVDGNNLSKRQRSHEAVSRADMEIEMGRPRGARN